jgi:hypothetical protein
MFSSFKVFVRKHLYDKYDILAVLVVVPLSSYIAFSYLYGPTIVRYKNVEKDIYQLCSYLGKIEGKIDIKNFKNAFGYLECANIICDKY